MFKSDFFWRLEYFHGCKDWWLLPLIFCLFESILSAFDELPLSVNRIHPTISQLNEILNCYAKIFKQDLLIYFILVPSKLTLEKTLSFSLLPCSTLPKDLLIFQYTCSLLFHTNLPFKSIERQYWHHHEPAGTTIKVPLLRLGRPYLLLRIIINIVK